MRVAAPARTAMLPLALTAGAVAAAALLAFTAAGGSLTVVIAILALVAAAAILADWALGIPILLFVSATDGFIKHYSSSSFTFVLKDVLLALILLGMTLRLGLNRAERPDNVRWRGMLAWAIYIAFLVTQLVNPSGTFGGALGAFRAHAAFGFLFIVGAIYFQRRERLTQTANLVIALCALCAFSAIAQHFMGDRWTHLSPGFLKASLHYTSYPSLAARLQGIQGASFRMYGTLVDPASLGLVCSYGVLFAVAALARLRGLGRGLAMASIPLIASGLVLSQARADMVALAVGLLVFAVLAMRRKATRTFAIGGLLLIGLAVPIGIGLTNGRVVDRVLATDSVAYAYATRDRSRDIVLSELPAFPFGHGLGAAGAGGNLRDEGGLAVDNVFYSLLYETGFIGLATFLALQLTMFVLGVRAAMRAKDIGAQTVFIGVVAAQAGLLASCWFSQGSFDYAPVAEFFWLFSGAVARADAWA